jgi:PHD/YefM family antitoxin component YafN of YafNO toxin-antitoxin module
MKGKGKRKAPQIILIEGKPRAVILDIDEYQEMLERLEDIEDLRELERMRKGSMSFRKLDDFLKEYSPGV